MAQAVLSLGAAIVLARILTPDAFGVFAMAVPLGVVANQVAGQAFQTTLLQREGLTSEEASDLFRFAVRINLGVAAAMAIAGVVLAAFYREPRLPAVVVPWALITWLLTITTFQEALLKRSLRFPAVMLAQFVGLVSGIAAAVAAAQAGAGYWALPIQLFVTEVVRALGVARASRWMPKRLTASVAGAGELRRSWRSVVGYSLTTWLADQPDLLAVGRVGGAHALGLYDTARRWARYPFEEPYLILGDLAVAGARGAGDPASVERFLTRTVMATLTLSLPAIAFVGATAPEIVPVLLGAQWTDAIPLLRMLCVVAFAGALSRVAYWIPLARGASSLLLRWTAFVQLPFTVCAVLVGLRWGPMGVARALAVVTTLLVIPCFVVLTRAGSVRVWDLAGAVWRPVVASLAAAAAVLGVDAGQGLRDRLLMAFGVFLSAFVASWLLLPGGVAQARSMARNVRTLGSAP